MSLQFCLPAKGESPQSPLCRAPSVSRTPASGLGWAGLLLCLEGFLLHCGEFFIRHTQLRWHSCYSCFLRPLLRTQSVTRPTLFLEQRALCTCIPHPRFFHQTVTSLKTRSYSPPSLSSRLSARHTANKEEMSDERTAQERAREEMNKEQADAARGLWIGTLNPFSCFTHCLRPEHPL